MQANAKRRQGARSLFTRHELREVGDDRPRRLRSACFAPVDSQLGGRLQDPGPPARDRGRAVAEEDDRQARRVRLAADEAGRSLPALYANRERDEPRVRTGDCCGSRPSIERSGTSGSHRHRGRPALRRALALRPRGPGADDPRVGLDQAPGGYLPLTIDEGYRDPELITVFACIALRRAQKATPAEVPALFERLSRRSLRLGDHDGDGRARRRPRMPALLRQARARTAALLGQLRRRARRHRRRPRALWDARLGFFGVSADEVGELTPAQLLGCVDLFQAMHGRRVDGDDRRRTSSEMPAPSSVS